MALPMIIMELMRLHERRNQMRVGPMYLMLMMNLIMVMMRAMMYLLGKRPMKMMSLVLLHLLINPMQTMKHLVRSLMRKTMLRMLVRIGLMMSDLVVKMGDMKRRMVVRNLRMRDLL